MDERTTYLLSDRGSERATSGGGGKVLTRNGKTHVVWQDRTAEGYVNRVRTLDHATGELTDPVTLNEAGDNHSRPNLLVDHDGYLHAVLSGHNSPVTYRRSLEPGDASGWTDAETIGEGTYPVPVCARDGTLFVAMRSAERWNGVDLYARPPDGSWRRRTKLVTRHPDLDGYAAFHSGLVVGDGGTLHAVIDFYEGEGVYDRRGLHQAVAAMQSPDGGHTWTKADGTRVEAPARPPGMDVIARDRARERLEDKPRPVVLAKGNIALDGQSRPHVIYIDHRRGPGRIMHARTGKNGEWSREPITALDETVPAHRAIDCRGALTVREDGTLFALFRLLPLGDGWQNGLPTRALATDEGVDCRLGWLFSQDGGRTWRADTALDSDRWADRITHVINQPNVERSTGGAHIDGDQVPRFVFFDGEGSEEGVVRNAVYLIADPEIDGSTVPSPSKDTPSPYRNEDHWRHAVPDRYRDRPAFVYPEADASLPNVLVIGDSISMSYTPLVRERLAGVATVYRAPENCRTTRQTLDRIETYLGGVDWDVIPFNCGIHDVTLVDESGEAAEGGDPQVPIEEYRTNLERIVRRLKATGAVPVWVSTTPVADHVEIRRNDRIDAYNEAATGIMETHFVPTVDLNRVVREHDESVWTGGVHFTETGAALLAGPVAETIRTHLGRDRIEESFF